MVQFGFETIGNATLVFRAAGAPVLATDPWLKGTCYFGSWALDRPLTDTETDAVVQARYIWISHGHPDHLHPESLALLPRGKKILVPDHYTSGIADWLKQQQFDVEIMPYRKWRQLSPGIRCLCLDNENQDAILIVEVNQSLVVNLNDSPLCGDARFIRNLVHRYDRRNTYLAALCAIDADMLNIVDRAGKRVIGPPEERKPGMVWATARIADRLGVGSFVCSSSQHLYVRGDSLWANPYRITWDDIQRHWSRPHIRLLEPFVAVDLETGAIERKHPNQTSDLRRTTSETGDDDYGETLSEPEWGRVVAFFRRFSILGRFFDFVDVVVGGERRRVWLGPRANLRAERDRKGFSFHVPRRSLLATVESGYFDDLLIGNFMKTELQNATLYPHFTPLVSKLGGNASVYAAPEWRIFRRRYFRRNPLGVLEWRAQTIIGAGLDFLRMVAESCGVKGPLKRLYRGIIGDPVA